MAFFVIALVLEPLEMVFQSYRLLEPWLYLSFQVYKALLSTTFLIFSIYAYVSYWHIIRLPKALTFVMTAVCDMY